MEHIERTRRRRHAEGHAFVPHIRSIWQDPAHNAIPRQGQLQLDDPIPDWYNHSIKSGPMEENERFEKDEFPSLYSIARACIFKHLLYIRAESLQGLEWYYGQVLWDNICTLRRDTFSLFAAFATNFGKEHDFLPTHPKYAKSMAFTTSLRQWNQAIRLHEGHLSNSNFLPRLISPTFAWLVFLSFGGKTIQFSKEDFIALGDLPNLAALDLSIEEGDSKIDAFGDIVLANWARRVKQDEQAFSRLKYIDMRGRSDGFFERNPSLTIHLATLPVLKFINISRRSKMADGLRRRLRASSKWSFRCERVTSRVHQDPTLKSRSWTVKDRMAALRFDMKSSAESLYDLLEAYESLVVQHAGEDKGSVIANVRLASLDPPKNWRKETAIAIPNQTKPWDCMFLERKEFLFPSPPSTPTDEMSENRPTSNQLESSNSVVTKEGKETRSFTKNADELCMLPELKKIHAGSLDMFKHTCHLHE